MSRKRKVIYGILVFLGFLFFLSLFSTEEQNKKKEQPSKQSIFESVKDIQFFGEKEYKKLIEQIKARHPELILNYHRERPDKDSYEAHFVNTQIGAEKEFLVIGKNPASSNSNIYVIFNCELEKINCFDAKNQKKITQIINTIFEILKPEIAFKADTFVNAMFHELKQSIKTKELSYEKEHVIIGENPDFLINLSCSNECQDRNKGICKVSYCKFEIYPYTLYLQYYKKLYGSNTIGVFYLNNKGNFVAKEVSL